ncbi:penicillin-binding protein 2 [Alicyclobacillus sp. SO9]|uniref:peptidoglycan D,D-transpeptidase FtsI family protein n=1 Tax=Alicyclobacillus sp. SO9 TaxID=2665646 RepID=UPI0018E86E9A|nr:penicillin-binding protein 2 [Alicyclobacillus sp. SO9]QQE79814.1 PASTA domain-containing protein [Alicyclobacillus sp. SO9]
MKLKKAHSSRHSKRVLILQVVTYIGLGLVVLRMQVLQNWFGPSLLAQAKQTQQVTKTVLAPRGKILDAEGQPLAYDVPSFMMDIKVKGFKNRQKLASMLSKALGIPVSKILGFVSTKKYTWVQWPNSISELQKQNVVTGLQKLRTDALNAAKAAGKQVSAVPYFTQFATFTPTEKRIYPFNTFAANTVGYVDRNGTGQTGLEQEFNRTLSGKNGQIEYTRDGDGFPISSTLKVVKSAQPGMDIKTTLNATIQAYVQQAIKKLVNKYHPNHAAIIVENPKTGAILGMASRPTFNPNQYWKGSSEALSTNWAVNSVFEPGSTFKPIVLAAALATKSVNLAQTYMSGHITVQGHRIYDWNRVGWGKLTFRGAMEKSSNVGFATIALRLGWQHLMHYLKAFGYLNRTGIKLPGEATSIMFSPQNRGKLELATAGFGQGIAVTPLQQIAGIGALANGGKLMKPYIVKQIVNPSTGKAMKTFHPTVVNPQVVPTSIANTVSKVMTQDVNAKQGIDQIAAIKGYDVAGKSGTAQIVNPKTGKYYANKYAVSFVGYAPGWDPTVEVYVTVYGGHTKPGKDWGSTVSGPAAREILKESMQYYHIAPRLANGTSASGLNSNALPPVSATTHYIKTPKLAGASLTSAVNTLNQDGFHVQVGGTGNVVKRQWPQPGVSVSKGTNVYLYAPGSKPASTVTMPNLQGMPLREAGNILAVLGLQFSANGVGYVSSQSVPAGTTVKRGHRITVNFTSG